VILTATTPDPTVTGANFVDFFVHLSVNLIGLVVLAVVVYYRRHRRRDLLTCMVCFNVSIFVVFSVLDVRDAGVGLGFGLFALLSIITLRSETFSTIELGYLFSAVIIGVVNALEVGGGVLTWQNELFAALVTTVVVAAAYVADHPGLRKAAGHQQITLDRVYPDAGLMRADLEQRLGVVVTTATVLHTNCVEETTLVDVGYEAPNPERGHLAGSHPASIDQQ
jgi:hypothetical protein